MAKSTKIYIACASAVLAIILGSEIFKTVRFRKYCESTDGMKTHIDTVRSFSTQARRGDILDCKGNILATIDTVYNVHFDAALGKDSVWVEALPALSTGLAEILKDRTPSEYNSYLNKGRAAQRRYLEICKDVGQSTLDSLKSLPLFNLPFSKGGGMIVETIQKRVYPYGPLARRTIGFVRNNPELYNNHIGIEGSFNKALSGKDGYGIIKDKHIRLPFGKIKHIHKAIKVVNSENGENVKIELDIKMQAAADSILRAAIKGHKGIKGACLMTVSTNSGAIRTMVNLTKDAHGVFGEYYNVSIGYGYEPGRIIAPATALAAAKCNSALSLEGMDLTSREALADMACKCCPSAYCDSLKMMLHGENSLGLEGLSSLNLVSPDDNSWSDNTLASIANGYSIMAPAIRWLALYTAIARDGDGIAMHLVDSPAYHYRLCSKEQADALAESMKAASAARMSGTVYEMAGLTGASFIAMPGAGYTDEYGRHAMQSSYAGFFPADTPAFSIICMVYSEPMTNPNIIKGIPSKVVKAFVGSRIVAERVKETLE